MRDIILLYIHKDMQALVILCTPAVCMMDLPGAGHHV